MTQCPKGPQKSRTVEENTLKNPNPRHKDWGFIYLKWRMRITLGRDMLNCDKFDDFTFEI